MPLRVSRSDMTDFIEQIRQVESLPVCRYGHNRAPASRCECNRLVTSVDIDSGLYFGFEFHETRMYTAYLKKLHRVVAHREN